MWAYVDITIVILIIITIITIIIVTVIRITMMIMKILNKQIVPASSQLIWGGYDDTTAARHTMMMCQNVNIKLPSRVLKQLFTMWVLRVHTAL